MRVVNGANIVKEVIFDDLGLLPNCASLLFLKPNGLFTLLVLLTLSLAFILYPLRIVSPFIRQPNGNIHCHSFSPSWKAQAPSSSCSIPMKIGTAYVESLAHTLPLDTAILAQVKAKYVFKFHPILISCMHLALWTQLDVFTLCVILAQYQIELSNVLIVLWSNKWLVYLLHPDLPLTFCGRFLNTHGWMF
jgi:hypothetical protein